MGTANCVQTDDERLAERLARASKVEHAFAKIVLVSGGFDPLHIGHIRMLQHAHTFGRVYVALNSDRWLVKKKGAAFMPWNQRAEILSELRSVFTVLHVRDADGTVCEALSRVRPHYFANGGDRTTPNEKEHAFCERAGIEELFNIGGGKVESSSALLRRHGTLAARDSHKDAVSG